MKRMSMALACAVLSVALLTGCFGAKWTMGENVVTPDGTIEFYNGIDVGFNGVVEVIADAQELNDIQGTSAFNSTYSVTTEEGQFAYIATQISSSQPIMNIFNRTISDDQYADMIGEMTDLMISQITQVVPSATVTGPEIERAEVRSDSGTVFDVGTIVYNVQGAGQNIVVQVTTIIDKNNVTMIMTMRDGSDASNAIAEAVEGSISFR